MSFFDNPTALRIGQKAAIDGRQYTVLGRVLLSMEADGETYYWNEFNLVANTGQSATLVHEDTEDGAVWKWFELFEPKSPPTLAEAQARRVGDRVDFGEGRYEVTLVDQSRVARIEGQAPEGVEIGDVAYYFNAENGAETFVASWTGEEIEFYRGRALARGRVEGLFKLGPPPSSAPERTLDVRGFERHGGSETRSGRGVGKFLVKLVFSAVVIVGVVNFLTPSVHRTGRYTDATAPLAQPPIGVPQPPVKLTVGARGVLAGQDFEVRSKAAVHSVSMGGRQDEMEYELISATGETRLLVQGRGGYEQRWQLYARETPPDGFSAYDAAALRKNQHVKLAGVTPFLVQGVFMREARSVEGEPADGEKTGRLLHGVRGLGQGEASMMRWTLAGELRCYRGRALHERDVRAAFAAIEVEKPAVKTP